MNPCVCGCLKEQVKKPGSRLRYEAETGRYLLELSSVIVVATAFCQMCGSQGLPTSGLKFRKCTCGTVEKWESPKGGPVYKNKNGLFMLCNYKQENGHSTASAIWFCPMCGGRMRDGVMD